MANPNLANINTRLFDTLACNINTSPNCRIFRNYTTTSTLMKVVGLTITNKTIAQTALVDVRYFSGDKGGGANVTFSLTPNLIIPANTFVQIISPSAPFYIVEGDSLIVSANANGVIDAAIVYESLSDLIPPAHAFATSQIPYAVELMTVGGGGSGPYGGGGGGGLLKFSVDEVTAGQSYTVVVGAGGSSASTVNGANSNVYLVRDAPQTPFVLGSVQGGGFGPSSTPQNGNPGSSGGGGGGYGGGGGAGIAGLGQPGGGGGGYINGAGGGGGITGGGGGSWAYFHGGGGGGLADSFTGNPITYGNGGGGAGGGVGGGVGTGGGGSGGSPGAPGSVVIRYQGSQRGLGGNVTSSGGYTIHTFNTSGFYIA